MRAVIIAAGEGTRWDHHLGVPKHLAPVCGEAIIHRTQRQLAERGVTDVRVVATDPRYATTGKLERPRGFEDSRGGIKKFLDSSHLWNPHGRTLVIYGDVCFTDAAMDTIVGYDGGDWRLFCRFGESSYNPARWGECFAQSFHPVQHAEHLAALMRVRALTASGFMRRGGGWEHYRAMCGLTDAEIAARPAGTPHGRAIVIDDATDDVDRPADYQTLLEAFRCS